MNSTRIAVNSIALETANGTRFQSAGTRLPGGPIDGIDGLNSGNTPTYTV
ncbi:MAG: hypothetical protein IJI97_05945 [Clostridia bacterium]|nr:hypothetical protein [Clostridia bacterium]